MLIGENAACILPSRDPTLAIETFPGSARRRTPVPRTGGASAPSQFVRTGG